MHSMSGCSAWSAWSPWLGVQRRAWVLTPSHAHITRVLAGGGPVAARATCRAGRVMPWPRVHTGAACTAAPCRRAATVLRQCSRYTVTWRGVIAMLLLCAPTVAVCTRHLDRWATRGVGPRPWPLLPWLHGSRPTLRLTYRGPVSLPATSGSTNPGHGVTMTPPCFALSC